MCQLAVGEGEPPLHPEITVVLEEARRPRIVQVTLSQENLARLPWIVDY